MITIKVLDPFLSECSNIHQVKECLKYTSTYWKQGPYCRSKKDTPSYLCNQDKRREHGTFMTGFIPRVLEFCQRAGVDIALAPSFFELVKMTKPSLPGIVFRDDQYDLLTLIRKYIRGIVKSPTGSGKTVLAGAVISMLPKSKAVFVVHTASLFRQTIQEFELWFGPVGIIGDEEFKISRINVVMAQTARSLLKKDSKRPETPAFMDLLADCDVVICDEVHHAGEADGQYAMLLKHCLAPVRIGLTATPLDPKSQKGLVCEGLLGPIIGEFTIDEGIEKGIIAKPHVKLIPVPINPKISGMRKYRDVYSEGIINNKQRNRLIAKEINDQNKQGKSVLVMVVDVVNGHAEQIATIAKEVYGIKTEIVKGATQSDLREGIKGRLERKESLAVIATVVWREGINIKSLDCVINACGGKSEIVTLQAIGRGLRTTEGKTDLTVVDFLDPYDYLAQHTIQRISIYAKNGWIS